MSKFFKWLFSWNSKPLPPKPAATGGQVPPKTPAPLFGENVHQAVLTKEQLAKLKSPRPVPMSKRATSSVSTQYLQDSEPTIILVVIYGDSDPSPTYSGSGGGSGGGGASGSWGDSYSSSSSDSYSSSSSDSGSSSSSCD